MFRVLCARHPPTTHQVIISCPLPDSLHPPSPLVWVDRPGGARHVRGQPQTARAAGKPDARRGQYTHCRDFGCVRARWRGGGGANGRVWGCLRGGKAELALDYEGGSLYPIAILVDELRHDDISLRLNSVRDDGISLRTQAHTHTHHQQQHCGRLVGFLFVGDQPTFI
jgi:hypothetical protein